jgi:hypothetical protein
MAREDEHRTKAQRNEAFADALDLADPTRETWAVIAAFYSALHYVEAYFSKYSVQSGKHETRFHEILGDNKLKGAYTSYKYLYTLSRTARYHCTGLPTSPYTREAKPHLANVKRLVDHALSSN